MIARGRCHCGAITVEFESAHEAASLPLRACQCSFCRRHGARNVVDAAGRVRIAVDDGAIRYRFGLATADFLVCGRCGIYVGCVLDDAFASVNTRIFDAALFPQAATPVDYSGESAHARIARRRARWTPATVIRRL